MARFLCETLPWTKFGTVVVSLPVIGLAFCVIYSILYDFKETTITHGCSAYNFLPSISAASGEKEPQISVWWWSIVLHTPGRYFISLCYLNYYSTIASSGWKGNYEPLAIACVMVNLVEVTALLMLTLYSSRDYFEIHSTAFGIFLAFSIIYMLSVIAIQKTLYEDTRLSKLSSSIRYKKLLFAAYCCLVTSAMYLYYRHSAYCEAIVYSMFAFSEYLIVLTNIAFHSTFMLDFTSAQQPCPSLRYDKLWMAL
ncbi:post-GPI attachment to proteins factor 2-like isoform X2 [Watersipora subatra]|uniref:post-GPI attachment to proteins factor 2-like isoform X2 n=1 Tax=Watersipora subatra TaxID=2589382 RepID=UPI00355C11B1